MNILILSILRYTRGNTRKNIFSTKRALKGRRCTAMAQWQTVQTDLVVELLEVAFNTILYSRKLYPEESFAEKKIYATASHVCQHPEVKAYMEKALRAIRTLFVSDLSSITTIGLNIFDNHKRLIEKYVFNIQSTQDDYSMEQDPYFLKLEDHLRRVCLKLSMATSYLKVLPDESSFTIYAEASQRAYVAFNNKNSGDESFPWILADREKIDDDSLNTLIPLTCIKSRQVGVELFILKNELA